MKKIIAAGAALLVAALTGTRCEPQVLGAEA